MLFQQVQAFDCAFFVLEVLYQQIQAYGCAFHVFEIHVGLLDFWLLVVFFLFLWYCLSIFELPLVLLKSILAFLTFFSMFLKCFYFGYIFVNPSSCFLLMPTTTKGVLVHQIISLNYD